MIKKLLITVGLLVVAGGGAVYFYLDGLVKSGIEVVGTEVLGSEVTVGAVSISPLNGSGSITDLRIRNPEGYRADSIFELGFIDLNVDINSLFSDVVVVNSITIAQPVITYETRITSDNIRALLAQLPRGNGAESTAETDSGTSTQIVIRELQLLDAQLTLSAGVASAPVRLPDIVLHDIGTEADAATIAEAVRVVLSAVSSAVLRADLPSMDLLQESLQNEVERAGQAIDGALDSLGNRLRSLGN